MSTQASLAIDLRATSCKDFIAFKPDDLNYVLAFLDGYYRTEDDSLIIDPERTRIKQLAAHCISNPEDALIDAAAQLLSKDQ